MPKISVIIPVYNTGKYLSDCLDSVISQTMSDIEIICIDDGSTDNSAEILKKYAKKDSRIKIITQKNSGVVVARNNGVAHATADLIYPLDSDDMVAKTTLQELYDAFVQHRGDVITSRVVQFGAETGEMVLPSPTKWNFCHANCSVNAALFRKSDFIKAGGYDTTYAAALEDYDLWLNFIYRQNLRFYRVNKLLFFYRIKDKNESRNWQHRNQHVDLVNSFYIKYPKMNFYMKMLKLLKPLKKIRRFFFRIQDNKVKIFKIPVWRIGLWGYWFQSRPNFGDLLNPFLFEYLGHRLSHTGVNACDVIAIGSLMELLFSDKKCKRIKRPLIVYGTGFIKAPDANVYLKRNLDVRAVRGYNTLARLRGIQGVKISENVVVGDPGLLAPILLDGEIPTKKYKLGIIPHYVDADSPLLKKITCKDTTIIDITLDPVSFMKKIAECENVISSAMHGLIAADSLGIPNIRMIISDKIIGGDYKYDDYYSAFGIKKHHRVDLRKESFTEKDLEELKNTYQIKKEMVYQKQIELISAFPYPIKRKICL